MNSNVQYTVPPEIASSSATPMVTSHPAACAALHS
jgi:hypothetical protein